MIVLIVLVSIVAACLTLFSGFGLGTILLPVFSIFFPLEIAVAMTAIVHFLNNIYKISLFYRNIKWGIILRFGITAVIASFLGANLLTLLSKGSPIYTYTVAGHVFNVTIIKVVIGSLIVMFSLFDLLPYLENEIQFKPKYLPFGGLLSGFFGGLSGHQGALRSAFLIKSGLDKKEFIATGVFIAILIDVSRLSVYISSVNQSHIGLSGIDYKIILLSCFAAFLGTFIGNKLVAKVTISFLQKVVGVMLIVIGVLLGVGLL